MLTTEFTCTIFQDVRSNCHCYNTCAGDYQHQGMQLKETHELLASSENRLEEARGTFMLSVFYSLYMHVHSCIVVTVIHFETANECGFLYTYIQ